MLVYLFIDPIITLSDTTIVNLSVTMIDSKFSSEDQYHRSIAQLAGMHPRIRRCLVFNNFINQTLILTNTYCERSDADDAIFVCDVQCISIYM